MEPTSVRVSPETREELEELIGLIQARGWSAVGASRKEGATHSGAVAEAITQLLARAKRGR